MRALHSNCVYGSLEGEKNARLLKQRLKAVQSRVDTSEVQKFVFPTLARKKLEKEKSISKDNLKLARRIFEIMDKPGDISKQVNDTRHIDEHPGTLNFKMRLEEARRIQQMNMILAAKLDTIKTFYSKEATRTTSPSRGRESPLGSSRPQTASFPVNQDSEPLKDFLIDPHPQSNDSRRFSPQSSAHIISPRLGPTPPTSNPPPSSPSPRSRLSSQNNSRREDKPKQTPRARQVLLECSKVQAGRALDVAVVKEPFKDEFAIFGIDIESGQRFELRLSSGEVSSVLDGDMLVTSLLRPEVWLALLSKVDLPPSPSFSDPRPEPSKKLPDSLPYHPPDYPHLVPTIPSDPLLSLRPSPLSDIHSLAHSLALHSIQSALSNLSLR